MRFKRVPVTDSVEQHRHDLCVLDKYQFPMKSSTFCMPLWLRSGRICSDYQHVRDLPLKAPPA